MGEGVAEGMAVAEAGTVGVEVAEPGVRVGEEVGMGRSGGIGWVDVRLMASFAGVSMRPVGPTPIGSVQAARTVPIRRIGNSFLRGNGKIGEVINNFLSHQSKCVVTAVNIPQGRYGSPVKVA